MLAALRGYERVIIFIRFAFDFFVYVITIIYCQMMIMRFVKYLNVLYEGNKNRLWEIIGIKYFNNNYAQGNIS